MIIKNNMNKNKNKNQNQNKNRNKNKNENKNKDDNNNNKTFLSALKQKYSLRAVQEHNQLTTKRQ